MSYNYSGDSLLGMFLFETRQVLEQLEECILNTEKTGSFARTDIDEIFRVMHTIKGSAAMMKFTNISKVAHSLEDMFEYIRKGNLENIDYSSLSDLLLKNIDFISEQIGKIESGASSDEDATKLIEKNKDFLDNIENETKNTGKNSSNNQMKHLYKAVIHFLDDSEMENMRAFSVVNSLDGIADSLVYTPEDLMEQGGADIIKENGFRFSFRSNYSYVDIHQLLMQTIFLKELELEQIDEKTSDEDLVETKIIENNKEIGVQTPRQTITHQSIISVPVEKLDRLMDLMGEFVIAEAMVTQNTDLEGLELNNFDKAARQLNKITDELQDIVMSIRMVPISSSFNKMKRIVRDMGKNLDKEVELKIIGEETEVDKNIIEHISDPLMHLVRNALDHGLESKEEREKLGKPPISTITLEAKNVGNDVLIIVRDDGRGIDKDGVIEKAKAKGLLTRPETTMTDREIYSLILQPGFSTNTDVTEYSGRGVGMDVVTKNIEAMGGSISINSKKNAGSEFILKMPLTLAIIDGVNIRVGKSIYTIPTTNIREFFKPILSDIIIDPDKNEMVMVRGQCYPILRLHKLFKVQADKTDFEDGIFIIVQQDNMIMCIFADELIGQQQIVVKSLPEYISKGKRVKGLTGCTLLGDGSISLILDPDGLLQSL